MKTCESCVYYRCFTQEVNGKNYWISLCDLEEESVSACNSACDEFIDEEEEE